MVKLARVSRASYYRFNENAESGTDSDMDLRDAIQRVALEWPSYGRRRITRELHRRGWAVNWKRVYRLMGGDNLLCVRKRKFVVTTDSNHGRQVYPNLARQMVLTDVDQLWRADITYIRLREEFVFLAVVLDAYSRRVTPLSATCRRRSSKTRSEPLREQRHERDRAFFQAWRNLPADVFLLQKPGPKYRIPDGVGPDC